ncbi:MAG: hypothetical protein ACKO81_07545, partial [Planctomycetota bacterium]
MKKIIRNMNLLFVAIAIVSLNCVAGIDSACAQSPFSGRGIPDGSAEASKKSGWMSSESSG